jgi:hypothetical protein
MLHRIRTVLIVSAAMCALGGFAGATLACGGGTDGSPQRKAEITSPSGLEVKSVIVSVTLGDGFGSTSNLQLAFMAGSAGQSAPVEIASATLVDDASGAFVEVLAASAPQVWNGSRYTPWDQRVTPAGDLRASYSLTTPDWSKMDSGVGGSTRSSSYSRKFRLLLKLRIDGVEVVIESAMLNRQPQAVT